MIQELNYEKAKLDFLTTKQHYINNRAVTQSGEKSFINKETNTVITFSWAVYGKYAQLDYRVEALQ